MREFSHNVKDCSHGYTVQKRQAFGQYIRPLRIEEVVNRGIVEIKSQVLREREEFWLNFVMQKRSVI